MMHPDSFSVFEQIVERRRSIRLFAEEPVPPEVIERCLDIAMLAPNSSNLQPWEFHWIRTPELKKKIVEACFSQAAAATAPELVACIARTNTWRESAAHVLSELERHQTEGIRIPKAAMHYYRSLVPMMYRQGFVGSMGLLKRIYFFFHGLFKPMMREPVSHQDMKVWAVKSTSLACENFMLAAVAQGYDTCPMEGFDSARVRKLLKLPSDATCAMILSVGRRRPDGVTVPRIRGDRSRFVKIV